jgi:hypothetical protein
MAASEVVAVIRLGRARFGVEVVRVDEREALVQEESKGERAGFGAAANEAAYRHGTGRWR